MAAKKLKITINESQNLKELTITHMFAFYLNAIKNKTCINQKLL